MFFLFIDSKFWPKNLDTKTNKGTKKERKRFGREIID